MNEKMITKVTSLHRNDKQRNMCYGKERWRVHTQGIIFRRGLKELVEKQGLMKEFIFIR
jgi:hypothetical protein